MAVGSGFAEITPHCVSVLTDMAVEADAIDEAAAEAARKRAEESLKQKLGSDEQALVEAALQKALTQLSVKRKHRGQKAG
jgi:F-type H+-transporting ATPase subunit epsilon